MRRRRWLSAVVAFLFAAGSTPMLGAQPALAEPRAEPRGGVASSSAESASPTASIEAAVAVQSAPDGPAGFSAAPGDGIFTLTFDEPGDGGSVITGHEYSTDDGGHWRTLTDVTGTTSRQAVISYESADNSVPLAYNVPYEMKVRAVNAVGAGAPSDTVTATIAPKSPDAPGPVAVSVGGGAITLGFDSPRAYGSTITGWEYSTDNGLHWQALTVTGDGRLTAEVTEQSTGDGTADLEPGQVYQLRLHASSSAGMGRDTGTFTVSLPNPGAPAAPTSVTAVPADDSGFQISFTAPDQGASEIIKYQFSYDDGNTWHDNATTGDGTLHAVVSAGGGGQFRIRVRAVNTQGAGPPSEAAEVSLPATAPGTPYSLGVVAREAGGFALTFGMVPDNGSQLTGWEYTTDAGAHWLALTGVVGDMQLTATVVKESDGSTDLAGGATYQVRVRARNAVGAGPGSQTVTAALPNPGSPAAPGGVSASPAGNAFEVSFTAPSPGESAILKYQYSTDDGNSWSDTSVNGNGSLQAYVKDESGTGFSFYPGNHYRLRLRALNTQGPGLASAAVEVSLSAAAPGAPFNLGAVPSHQGGFELTFGSPPDNGSQINGWEYATDSDAHWRPLEVVTGDKQQLSAVILKQSTGDGTTPFASGTTYAIRVRARNAVGAGQEAEAVLAALPNPGSPAAPGGVSAKPAAAGGFGVDFTAPDQGDSAILKYQYSTDNGRSWSDTPTTGGGPLHTDVTGFSLYPGNLYRLRVRAVNTQGPGWPSAAVEVALPPAAPGAPFDLQLEPGDQAVTVTWGWSDNGSPITGYDYSTDGGATWQPLSPLTNNNRTTSSTILNASTGNGQTRLQNGQSYQVRLRATNSLGTGPGSEPVTVGLPSPGSPAAPTQLAGSSSGDLIRIDFTAPDQGDSAILKYQYSTDDGNTWAEVTTHGDGPLYVEISVESGSGLLLGRDGKYRVRVRAVNTQGPGRLSARMDVSLPPAKPGSPYQIVVVPGSRQATVTLSVTANGSEITKLEYSTDDGASWRELTDITPAGENSGRVTITNVSSGDGTDRLVDGVTYQLRLRVTNDLGTGPASDAVNLTTADTVPPAPTELIPTAADQKITIGFEVPDNGGSGITLVRYSTDGGTSWADATVTGTDPFTVDITAQSTGNGTAPLVNGVAYAVRLILTNAAGPGAASQTVTVTPRTTAGAPLALTAAPRNHAGALTFGAPADSGGSPVSAYQVSTDNGVTWNAAKTSGTEVLTATVGDLVNDQAYQVRVRAVTAAGPGTATGAVTVTPLAPPVAPTGVTAEARTSTISVSWTAPASGGAPVTGYTAIASPGPATCDTTTALTCVLGAQLDQPYTITVVAHSASGDSPVSPASASATAVAPVIPSSPPVTNDFLDTPAGDNTTPPGSTLTIRGTGYAPDSEVALVVYSAPVSLGTVLTDANGEFSVDVVVPPTLIGEHSIAAMGADPQGAVRSMRLDVTVAETPATPIPTSTTPTPATPTPTTQTPTTQTPTTQTPTTPTPAPSTPKPTPTIPSAPLGLAAAPRNHAAVLTFRAPADGIVSGYQVSIDSGASWSAATTSGTGELTTTIGDLVNDQAYQVRVRAVTAAGPGTATGAVTVTPLAPPMAPTGLTAEARTSTISVSWTAPASGGAPVTGYTAIASPGPATCDTTTATSCVLGAQLDQPYKITVVAHSASGDSPVSPASASVTAVAPVIPSSPPVTNDFLDTPAGDNTTPPGSTLTIRGAGYAPDSEVALVVYSAPVSLGTVVTDANGEFSTDVVLPPTLIGEHSIAAIGADPAGNVRSMRLDITVGDVTPTPSTPTPTPTTPAPTLAPPGLVKTGPATTPMAVVGLLMLLFGAGLLGTVRPRSRRAGR